MKKRYMILALIIVMTTLVFNACTQNGECSHDFGKWEIKKEASCAGPGSQSRQCEKCGYTETEEIRASIAHTEETVAAVAPTCTETGLAEGRKCSVCNTILTEQTVVAATGHKEVVDAAVAPTCTAAGLTEGKHCSVCNETTVAQTEVPATGHKEAVDAAVAPTCTAAGLTEGKHCSVCNETTVAQTEIPATGHTEVVDAAVAATCTTAGLTEGKHCSVCNEATVAQTEIPATGHAYEAAVIAEPFCNQDGMKQYTCANCSDTYTEALKMQEYTASEIYDMTKEAVGEIITYDKNGNAYAIGTGFVYSSDGMIITNYHVMEDAWSAEITLNGVTYDVEYVLAYDKVIDLAVLKINASNLKVLPICTREHAVGKTVYAFGSSQGLTATFSQGIITYAAREVDGVMHIQHDAAISGGNSGGPLINQFGEIIGINTFTIRDSQNLNFAVSIVELSNLDFSNPMTLKQVYEAERNPFDILKAYILSYGDFYPDDNEYSILMEPVISSTGSQFITYYNYDLTYQEIELCITIDWDIYLYIYMSEEGVYGWDYIDIYGDYMYGLLDAGSFTENSSLSYIGFELNDYDTPTELCDWSSYLAQLLCGWLDLDLEPMGLTAEDLGFLHF